ncbi:MAG: hypothetical protein ACJ785_07760, partial [Gemmatimonadaceae bacterium]
MDARTLLRRYLEQRRELGESELVLDSLHVEDVMRLLGAAGTRSVAAKQPSLRELAEEGSPEGAQDWRATLREAGVNVDDQVPAAQAVAANTTIETPSEMAFKKGLVVESEDAELIPSAIEKLDTLEEIAKKVAK